MMLDIQAIRGLLTHRYPFLLVDRVTELEEKQSIRGYKNVTVNEPFFNGHFPDLPIMPGVLILEAMAQLCGVLGYQSLGTTGHNGDTIWVIAGIDGARFKKPVVPGDRLELSAVLGNKKQSLWKFECEAKVDGVLAAKAVISVAERAIDA